MMNDSIIRIDPPEHDSDILMAGNLFELRGGGNHCFRRDHDEKNRGEADFQGTTPVSGTCHYILLFLYLFGIVRVAHPGFLFEGVISENSNYRNRAGPACIECACSFTGSHERGQGGPGSSHISGYL